MVGLLGETGALGTGEAFFGSVPPLLLPAVTEAAAFLIEDVDLTDRNGSGLDFEAAELTFVGSIGGTGGAVDLDIEVFAVP